VRLKIPSGTTAGKQLRLGKRGLPKPREGQGDLYVIVQIAVPTETTEGEKELYRQLAAKSTFNPRVHFEEAAKNADRTH
jgi:curved DNA-binding protein